MSAHLGKIRTHLAWGIFAWLGVGCSGPDVALGNGVPRASDLGSGGSAGSGGAFVDANRSESSIESGADETPARRTLGAVVIRLGDLGTASTTSGSSTGSTTGSSTGSATAGSSAVTTGGGTQVDLDKRFLFVGNAPPTCEAPWGGSPCDRWLVTVGIPSTLFQPGFVSLADPRIDASYAFAGLDRGGGDCLGGGGPLTAGTLEIVDIGTAVAIRMTGTASPDVDADGAYDAVPCQ